MKILPTEFFKSPVYCIKLLTVKDTSGTNLRTSPTQLSGKAVSIES